ncbi:hypothetical protein PM082_002968 [Marasmius tenuissimus]|nr:hypothetical protein PM082_002968 [Marasmius tenuissimus]
MSPSSPEPPFMPRAEFIRENKSTPSSFALLTFSGPNCIRLYSFTSEVIATLRRFLEQRAVIQGTREDAANNLYEFALDGKPWSNPKSLATERFVVDLLAVLYRSGYNYLSTIDYGREPDDRLAITLSCPVTSFDAPRPHSPTPQGSGSTFSEKQRQFRAPFALSFSSSTTLRVIQPPLHSTPAILQAVRSAWPRGVESEKKVGDNCFEFKLKGYKWFQEDTFAADSLRHILALLSSLDTHSFTLQASMSLSNRSRVKDLWIFTGPPSSDDALSSSSPSLFSSSQTALKRSAPTPEPVPLNSHKRMATEPAPLHDTIPTTPVRVHHRAVTDDAKGGGHSSRNGTPPPHSPASSTGNVLRKPAPRAQVPVSVYDGDVPDSTEYRAVLPSVISEGIPNMTGVGATPDVFYSTSPFGTDESRPTAAPIQPQLQGSPLHQSPVQTSPSRVNTPPQTPPHAAASESSASAAEQEQERDGPSSRDPVPSLSGPLLSPGAFRDSAFSSSTEMSKEIPIKWTGEDAETFAAGDTRLKPTADRLSSAGPMLPGGWQATPVEEDKQMPPQSPSATDNGEHMPDLKQNVRVASPEITDPDQGIRQSEAALMGVIPNEAPPPVPPLNTEVAKPREESTASGSGQGWVLVNVEGKHSATGAATDSSEPQHGNQGSESSASTNPSPQQTTKPTSENASMSPAAKAIVIIDAVDAKSKPKKDPPSTSRVRRFFSLSRKDSPKLADKLAQEPNASNASGPRTRSRSGFGQRLRRIGTPEATRNEDNRRSFD